MAISETLSLLKSILSECYDAFYAKYWEHRSNQLNDLAIRLKKAANILCPLSKLEKLVNRSLSLDKLEVFLIDIFRTGGGIYGVSPNGITCTLDERSVLTMYLDISQRLDTF